MDQRGKPAAQPVEPLAEIREVGRALDLAAHFDGLWLPIEQSFSLAPCCAQFSSEFLAAYGAMPRSNGECPFCRLVRRYGTDPRLQAAFPVRQLPDLS